MNEKCAAGSGGFLERATKYLEVGIDDIGPLSLGAAPPQPISSACAALGPRFAAARGDAFLGLQRFLKTPRPAAA